MHKYSYYSIEFSKEFSYPINMLFISDEPLKYISFNTNITAHTVDWSLKT
jgi:hypothetical protein